MELKRLGKYELQERLGRGGMGEVWKARDTELGRYVAIKLLHADLQANPDFVTHFKREAQFIASLHHPNIVQIHDFELTDTSGSSTKAYMVMDYIEGGTLADYIRQTSRMGVFPPAADIVYLFTAIGLALDYAHQKGMIHRDIKPANILLDKPNTGALTRGGTINRSPTTSKSIGEPILSDFGIAKLQRASSATFTRAAIGTPLYISPEQAEGRVVDERSDLYSLGIIVYELVTGVTPFRGDSPIAIMMQHIYETPTPPALINPTISPELSTFVLQSIAKDPEARFPTASAMAVALAQALNVPVPSNLNKPTMPNEQSDYNPLQLSRPITGPGRAGSLGSFHQDPPLLYSDNAPAVSSPGRNDLSAGIREPGLMPTLDKSGTSSINRLSTSQGDRLSQSPPSSMAGARVEPSQEGQARATTFRPAQLRHRNLYIASIACVILLLIGIIGFAVFPLFFSKNVTTTPNPAGGVVGHIVFVNSSNAPHNTFDQLRIDLEGVPPPPAGKNYYAWLQTSNIETRVVLHWKLQVSNGGIHYLTPVDTNHTDLLAQSNLFLVTAEDVGSRLTIPDPDPSRHIYYAILSHTSSSSPTFEVKQCPSSSTSNPCI